MTRKKEFDSKVARLRTLLAENELAGILIGTPPNFAWATAGGNAVVNVLSPLTVAMLLVTPDAKYIVCNNIEADRMAEEEVGELECPIHAFPWHRGEIHKAARKLAGGKLGADHRWRGCKDFSSRIEPLRYSFGKEEIERYRAVGRDVGIAIGEAARAVRPGMRENQIAGRLREILSASGLESVVTLVAADERIEKYRHPVVTDRIVRGTAMLVTCARRQGLVVAATRIVHFGRLPKSLRRKHDAVAFVDATLIAATRPGVPFSQILEKGIAAYKEKRFGKEWRLHHQGGPAGYEPREFIVTPREKRVVAANQPVAWNPSITGTKSEDTILALSGFTEIVSDSPGWPMVEIEVGGAVVRRPDILVLQ